MKKKGAQQQKWKKKVSNERSVAKIEKEESVNPFELRINRKKHSTLGAKSKNDKGNVGVSRNRAYTNRLEYFKQKNKIKTKTNSFVDKRMADKSMSQEDLAIARLMKARKKKMKKNIYNLNDEDIELTHLGQPISSLEKTDEYESESDEEDAKLDKDFVDKAHFGGLFTMKNEEESQMTHREILDNLILESKRKKEEKKAEKEMNDDLTIQLDKDWKDVQSLVSGMRRKGDEDNVPKRDTYDMTLQELKFEPKGSASSALQSEEQLKKAAEDKLKKLEDERKARMRNPLENNKLKKLAISEMSADSIFDGLDIEESFEPNETLIDDEEEKDSDNDISSDDEKDDTNINNDIDEMSELSDEVSDDSESEEESNSTIPQTVSALSALLNNKSSQNASSIMKSLIKSYHPSLGAGNKAILEKLFSVTIKYLSTDKEEYNLDFLDALVPELYKIGQISPMKTGLIFRKCLFNKMLKYSESSPGNFPSFDVLVLLKLCSILYSTSDFHHPIATPAMYFMSDMLTSPYQVSLFNVFSRLFLCSLFYEYVSFSKRLATEPIFFLQDVLYMASTEIPVTYIPRYRSVSKMKGYLCIDSKSDMIPGPMSMKIFCEPNSFENELESKVSILFLAVSQLTKFVTLYYDNIAFSELFSVVAQFLSHLPVNFYPKELKNTVSKLEELLSDNLYKEKKHLTYPNRKPRMIKMLEPKFKMNNEDEDEKEIVIKQLKKGKQLSQKIKREERGLLREIRRDAQFEANQHLKQKKAADEERRQKVKRLYQDLSIQQGECKKFLKKK